MDKKRTKGINNFLSAENSYEQVKNKIKVLTSQSDKKMARVKSNNKKIE